MNAPQFRTAMALTAFVGVLLATPAAAQDMKTIAVNGTELEYVEQGTGQPIVFVHGSIQDYRVFEGQREAISEDYQFVAYTRRYYGTRPWPDEGENFSDNTHVADLIAFIEGLDRGPVHMVTWSGGGTIGMLAALDRPDLFRSMVYFEPGGGLRQLLTTEEGAAADQERKDVQAPANAALEAGNLEEAVELFVDATWNTPGAFDQLTPDQQAASLDSARTLALRASGEVRPLTCEGLRGLDVPTAVIVGDQTLKYFDLIADAIVECLPDAEKKVISGASHGAPQVQAEEVNALILEFVSQHDD